MTDVLLDSNVVLRLLAIDDARHAIAADAVCGRDPRWTSIVRAGVRGKRAHDARLAAHMLAHGVRLIMTFNVDDFASIEGVVAFAPGQPIPSVR